MSLLRVSSGVQAATNVDVFFDLVYAFAVTQLSHYLLEDATVEGALQTTLLLARSGWSGRRPLTLPTG